VAERLRLSQLPYSKSGVLSWKKQDTSTQKATKYLWVGNVGEVSGVRFETGSLICNGKEEQRAN